MSVWLPAYRPTTLLFRCSYSFPQSVDNTNKNMYTGLIFLDITKAVDIVIHDVLLNKLDQYGVEANQAICCDHFQKENNTLSSTAVTLPYYPTTLGSPSLAQGSTLGPRLFLIYITDLPYSVNCIPRLFADDMLFSSHGFYFNPIKCNHTQRP